MSNVTPDPREAASSGSSVSPADPVGVGSEAQDNIEAAPSDDTDRPKLDQLPRPEAAQTQFPSLHGQAGVEVAERSADVAKAATRKHRKVFRIFTGAVDFVEAEFDHGPNFTAVRQYMANHGLRPLGDVSFVGAEKYDARNTDLTYEVEAVPAQVATTPATAHVVISQD